MPKNSKVRNDLIKEVRLLLGDGMVDIELDPDHYDLAVEVAISKIQQRSENAVEEDFYSIELKKDVDEYTLPKEIMDEYDGITLPMQKGSRSLNLANCVSIVAYEAWRQLGFRN